MAGRTEVITVVERIVWLVEIPYDSYLFSTYHIERNYSGKEDFYLVPLKL